MGSIAWKAKTRYSQRTGLLEDYVDMLDARSTNALAKGDHPMARVTVRHVPLYTTNAKTPLPCGYGVRVLAGSLALARNHSSDCSL